MLGRALTSILWGIVADRYGRKPIVMIGIVSVLNGLLGPMKFRADWGIGLIIGPALEGYLAQPVEKYPHLFPKDSFWDKFPYFLPSLTISVFAIAVLINCIWLPETLHYHPHSDESTDDAEALEIGSSETDKDKKIQKDENLFLNWPLMSSIIVYCIISLHDIAYQEVIFLHNIISIRLGGLSFTTDNVGDVLAVTGVGLIIFQLAIYPSLERAFGPIRFARINELLMRCYPYLSCNVTLYSNVVGHHIVRGDKCCFRSEESSDLETGWTLGDFRVKGLSHSKGSIPGVLVTIITGLFLLQNRAVEQYQRGAANGLSMTAMSVCKSIVAQLLAVPCMVAFSEGSTLLKSIDTFSKEKDLEKKEKELQAKEAELRRKRQLCSLKPKLEEIILVGTDVVHRIWDELRAYDVPISAFWLLPYDGKELEFDFSLDDLETIKVFGKDNGGVFIFWFNYNIQKDPQDRLTSSDLLSHPFIKKFEDKDLDLEILVGTLEPPVNFPR
ncbi:hypothetical protein RIF29_03743 [Crotalaria pallida]|uniref:Uncharacterized protein n=1 Tax=Crotalaria pallida TaxID=3830 RepID=A0AAN9J1L5_CROPI